MGILDYNEIKERTHIVYEGDPYEVMESHVARTQQRKPQNQVKMKNLITGRTVTTVFHAAETAEEADIIKKDITYMYSTKGENWFCEAGNPKNRFILSDALIGESKKWLKENSTLLSLIFDYDGEEKIIGVEVPIKMDFRVQDAPPNIKGNTATGGNKLVTLENGTVIGVPLFIEAGETVRVNTRESTYVERVSA